MGFSSLIDILGSIVIGGYLVLLLMRLNGSATENSFTYNEELVLQQNLTSVAKQVEYDFRKIGYCRDFKAIPDPSKAILLADSTRIKFLTDVDKNGVVDTLFYYLGPTSDLNNTANPHDRYLYRVINRQTPVGVNMGVTEFNMIFLAGNNDTIPHPVINPGEIASLEINIAVEKSEAFGLEDKQNKYSGAFWRQIRLVARNLENR